MIFPSKPNLEPTEPLVCPKKPNFKKPSQTLNRIRFDPTLEDKHEDKKDEWCEWCKDLEDALDCMDPYRECYDFADIKKYDYKSVVEAMAEMGHDVIWKIKDCPIWCDRIEECKNGDGGATIGLIIVGALVGSFILISVLSVIVVMVRLNKSKGR